MAVASVTTSLKVVRLNTSCDVYEMFRSTGSNVTMGHETALIWVRAGAVMMRWGG
jgi:hypothetical protein